MKKILTFILIGLLSLGFFVTNAQSQAVPPLVFTENSSTDLTVTLGGVSYGTIGIGVPITPDIWDWFPPAPLTVTSIVLNAPLEPFWIEPGSPPTYPTYVNLLEANNLNPAKSIEIFSDIFYPEGTSFPLYPDAYIYPSLITINYSDGTSNTFSAQIIDNGDTPAVPEPSTMLLLGSGLIGLAGYGRKKLFKK